MNERFARAQVVYLKSGGPGMTIQKVTPTDAMPEFAARGPLLDCTWFDGKKLREKSFFADLVQHTNPAGVEIKPPMPNETERDRV